VGVNEGIGSTGFNAGVNVGEAIGSVAGFNTGVNVGRGLLTGVGEVSIRITAGGLVVVVVGLLIL
jgi:hypothetical protein